MSYDERLISMAGGDGEADVLDEIEGRHADQATYSWPGLAHEAHADRETLLAMVREQRAAIERVEALHTFEHTGVEPWAAGYRYSGDHCGFDGEHWPCATIAALTTRDPS